MPGFQIHCRFDASAEVARAIQSAMQEVLGAKQIDAAVKLRSSSWDVYSGGDVQEDDEAVPMNNNVVVDPLGDPELLDDLCSSD